MNSKFSVLDSKTLNVNVRKYIVMRKRKFSPHLEFCKVAGNDDRTKDMITVINGDISGDMNEVISEVINGDMNEDISKVIYGDMNSKGIIGNLNGDTNVDITEGMKRDIKGEMNKDMKVEVNEVVNDDMNECMIGNMNGDKNADVNEGTKIDMKGDMNEVVNGDMKEGMIGNMNRDTNLDMDEGITGDMNEVINGDMNESMNLDIEGDMNEVIYGDMNVGTIGNNNGDENVNMNEGANRDMKEEMDEVLNGVMDRVINGSMNGDVEDNVNMDINDVIYKDINNDINEKVKDMEAEITENLNLKNEVNYEDINQNNHEEDQNVQSLSRKITGEVSLNENANHPTNQFLNCVSSTVSSVQPINENEKEDYSGLFGFENVAEECETATPEKVVNLEDNADLDITNEISGSFTKMEFGYPCLKCGAITYREETAQRHKEAHYTGYSCSYCPQVFIMEYTAKLHQDLHMRGEMRHVDDFCQCKLCGGSFVSLLYLEFHILELHGEDILKIPKVVHLGSTNVDDIETRSEGCQIKKLYKCGTCKLHFAYGLNLDCHMVIHPKAIYSCVLCESTFSLLDLLVQHVRNHEESNNSHSEMENCISIPRFSYCGEMHNNSIPLGPRNTYQRSPNYVMNCNNHSYPSKVVKYIENEGIKCGGSSGTNLREIITKRTYNLCPSSTIETSSQVSKKRTWPFNMSAELSSFVTKDASSTNNVQEIPYINPYLMHFLPNKEKSMQQKGNVNK